MTDYELFKSILNFVGAEYEEFTCSEKDILGGLKRFAIQGLDTERLTVAFDKDDMLIGTYMLSDDDADPRECDFDALEQDFN